MLVIWVNGPCVIYDKLALDCSHKLFCIVRPPMGQHEVGIVDPCTASEGGDRIQSCHDSEEYIVIISCKGISSNNDFTPAS